MVDSQDEIENPSEHSDEEEDSQEGDSDGNAVRVGGKRYADEPDAQFNRGWGRVGGGASDISDISDLSDLISDESDVEPEV